MKTIRTIKISIVTVLAVLSILVLDAAESHCADQFERVVKSKAFKKIPCKIIKTVKIPKGYHEGLFLTDGAIWINNGKGINTWVADIVSGNIIKEIKPVADFTEATAAGPDGTILTTDWYENKVYKVKIVNDTMMPEQEMFLGSAHPAGLVWNGDHIYTITWTRSVFGTKFHLLEIDWASGKILRKLLIGNIEEPAHMAWDGKYLWITSWYKKAVYKMDVDKMELLGYFKSPVSKTTGIVWDGKYFWLTGTCSDLYQVEVG